MAPSTASPSEAQCGLSRTPANHSSTWAMSSLTGTNQASTSPAAIPPRVNSSGRMRASRSENVNPTNNALKRQNFTAARDGPSRQTKTKNSAPVSSSTTGYRTEMAALQCRSEPHQQRAQEAELHGRQRRPEPPDEDEEQRTRQQLDDRIPYGNGRLAMPAAAAEQRVAEQRDVVVPGNRMAASRAVGAGPYHRKILRQAVDAYVEEAADQQAEQQRQAGF